MLKMLDEETKEETEAENSKFRGGGREGDKVWSHGLLILV